MILVLVSICNHQVRQEAFKVIKPSSMRGSREQGSGPPEKLQSYRVS